jgi:hypothetical protein
VAAHGRVWQTDLGQAQNITKNLPKTLKFVFTIIYIQIHTTNVATFIFLY